MRVSRGLLICKYLHSQKDSTIDGPWWKIRRHCRSLPRNPYPIVLLHQQGLKFPIPLCFTGTCAVPFHAMSCSCFLLGTFSKCQFGSLESRLITGILMDQGSIWFRWVPRRTTSLRPKVICSQVHQVGVCSWDLVIEGGCTDSLRNTVVAWFSRHPCVHSEVDMIIYDNDTGS